MQVGPEAETFSLEHLLCDQEALLGGVCMSPIWISNLVVSQFRKALTSLSEFPPLPRQKQKELLMYLWPRRSYETLVCPIKHTLGRFLSQDTF